MYNKYNFLKNHYDTNPLTTKAGEIISTLNAAKGVMVENVEKLLDKDIKLDIVARRAERLGSLSLNISNYVNDIFLILG